MKIILIVPPITHKEMHGELASGGSDEPSLGLCYIAACLRQAGVEVKIIDALALRLQIDDVVREVISEHADLVGLTAVTLTVDRAHNLAKRIKEAKPNMKTILGGPHITALPLVTMQRYPHFDYGVIGEGDETTVNLVNALRDGSHVNEVKGIIYRKGEDIIHTESAGFVSDLDSLPLPAWDLLPDLATYYHPPAYTLGRLPSSSLITTRGCGFKCAFCFQEGFGRRVRAHSAERVLEMIEVLYHRYGIRDFRIVDDNFTLFRKRLISIAEGIKKRGLDISFCCCARIDTIDEEKIRILKSAGCWQISFGIESGVQSILDLVKKNITTERIEETLALVHKHGICTLGYFMIGFPTETEETIKQTIEFALKLHLDAFKMQFLTPLPGSPLYYEIDKYGSFDKDNYEAMNTDTEPLFIPHGLTKEKLIHYQKKAFCDFYFRPRIIKSYSRLLTRPGGIKKLCQGGLALAKLALMRG